jgi:hypothetical protein
MNCPICRGKIATTMMGKEWCPTCIGRQMAKDTIAKVKFPSFSSEVKSHDK